MPMDIETVKTSQHTHELLDHALAQITKQPKRRYSQQEIDEARGNLALMNDRVFMVTFCDNKNNPIITGIVNALRKIHALAPIPPIERTTVQNDRRFAGQRRLYQHRHRSSKRRPKRLRRPRHTHLQQRHAHTLQTRGYFHRSPGCYRDQYFGIRAAGTGEQENVLLPDHPGRI